MKVKWKPVLIAGICAEALLLMFRIPIAQYGLSDTPWYIGILLYLVPMFLGGLWIARKIESRYILHGVWVGIVANVVYFPMTLLSSLIVPEPKTSQGSIVFVVFAVIILLKIFGSVLGSYVGGKMSKFSNKEIAS